MAAHRANGWHRFRSTIRGKRWQCVSGVERLRQSSHQLPSSPVRAHPLLGRGGRDQARVAHSAAAGHGASHAVIGRASTAACDPVSAFRNAIDACLDGARRVVDDPRMPWRRRFWRDRSARKESYAASALGCQLCQSRSPMRLSVAPAGIGWSVVVAIAPMKGASRPSVRAPLGEPPRHAGCGVSLPF